MESSVDTDPPTIPKRTRSYGTLDTDISDHQSLAQSEVTFQSTDPAPISDGTPTSGPMPSGNPRRIRRLPPYASDIYQVLAGPLTEDHFSQFEFFQKRLLTEDKVRSFLTEYYDQYGSIGEQAGFEAWSLLYRRFCSDDFVHVRSSGNPINGEGLARMFSSGDTRVYQIKLVSIDSIRIMDSQRAAVALFTTDQIFAYKGIYNEDRAVVSAIIEFRDDELKIIHEHWTSGRPIPKETRWSTSE